MTCLIQFLVVMWHFFTLQCVILDWDLLLNIKWERNKILTLQGTVFHLSAWWWLSFWIACGLRCGFYWCNCWCRSSIPSRQNSMFVNWFSTKLLKLCLTALPFIDKSNLLLCCIPLFTNLHLSPYAYFHFLFISGVCHSICILLCCSCTDWEIICSF